MLDEFFQCAAQGSIRIPDGGEPAVTGDLDLTQDRAAVGFGRGQRFLERAGGVDVRQPMGRIVRTIPGVEPADRYAVSNRDVVWIDRGGVGFNRPAKQIAIERFGSGHVSGYQFQPFK